jgi:hypothetical protein
MPCTVGAEPPPPEAAALEGGEEVSPLAGGRSWREEGGERRHCPCPLLDWERGRREEAVAAAPTGDGLMARVSGMNIYTDVCFCGLRLHVLMGHLVIFGFLS